MHVNWCFIELPCVHAFASLIVDIASHQNLDGVNGSANLDCYSQTRADLHCQLGWASTIIEHRLSHAIRTVFYRLISRSGYVVVDDTNRPQFDTSPWPWVVNQTHPSPSEHECSSVHQYEVCEIAALCGVFWYATKPWQLHAWLTCSISMLCLALCV